MRSRRPNRALSYPLALRGRPRPFCTLASYSETAQLPRKSSLESACVLCLRLLRVHLDAPLCDFWRKSGFYFRKCCYVSEGCLLVTRAPPLRLAAAGNFQERSGFSAPHDSFSLNTGFQDADSSRSETFLRAFCTAYTRYSEVPGRGYTGFVISDTSFKTSRICY